MIRLIAAVVLTVLTILPAYAEEIELPAVVMCDLDADVQATKLEDALRSVLYVNTSDSCTHAVSVAVYRTYQARYTLGYINVQDYIAHKTVELGPHERVTLNYRSVLPIHNGHCIQADNFEGAAVLINNPPYYDTLIDSYYHWTDQECAAAIAKPEPTQLPAEPISRADVSMPGSLPNAGMDQLSKLAFASAAAILLSAGLVARRRRP